jgi:hypothetical protein
VGLLDTIRRWVDGDSSDDPLEVADDQVRPRRVWEEFLVKIAREVEAVMQREMFTPPGAPTLIPREYLIYLSNDDDKEWQGEKRRGLEQGLFHVLSERARELSGSTQLAAKSFVVELRVDGTLNKGEFRVQAIWDETEAGKTSVLPRQGGHLMETRLPGEISMPPIPPLPPADGHAATPESPSAANQNGDDTTPKEEDDAAGDDQTRVRPRIVTLYSIEIWRDGVRQAVIPVTRPEITIGRGSRSVTVDLPLKGDPEISRLHLTLTRDDAGSYWITPQGRNSTLVNGRELPRDTRSPVAPDDKIGVCTFTLRIQPQWPQL